MDDEIIPVPDEEADTWHCIECLTDDDCLEGSVCAADGECGPEFAPGPTDTGGTAVSDGGGDASADAGD